MLHHARLLIDSGMNDNGQPAKYDCDWSPRETRRNLWSHPGGAAMSMRMLQLVCFRGCVQEATAA